MSEKLAKNIQQATIFVQWDGDDVPDIINSLRDKFKLCGNEVNKGDFNVLAVSVDNEFARLEEIENLCEQSDYYEHSDSNERLERIIREDYR